ncbi:MAG: hypothetical protein ABR880_14990 [Candidatus Sulfotelmatobacter sp.]|jgi:hypothetical protein
MATLPGPAVIAFILIDANPVEVNSEEMRTFFPLSDGSQGVEAQRECDRQL